MGSKTVKTSISHVKHKNVNALLLESDLLAVTIIPESGAKIQSIYNKDTQKEILYQSRGEKFQRSVYGAKFGSGDFSGFDEIFPTIDECFYPTSPWIGTPVPDHGEVWALPWDYEVEENSIILTVSGVRFPYRIEKKVEFLRNNCLRLSYRATNLSNFDFDFIWSPHPFFVCDENTKVVLPPSVKKVTSTCSLDNKLGEYGTIHLWPITETSSGEKYDISDVMHPQYAGKCEKFYATNKPLEGWCALHNTASGETIGLSYPTDKLPYLGVWEGIINDKYVTALEPVTGALDRLDIARLANKAGVIKAKSKYEWFLNLTFQTAGQINDIDQDGYIK
jgi:galactose mutarotase-like enzyme